MTSSRDKIGTRQRKQEIDRADRCLLVFSKPARPGLVKTRLIGELTPQQAADLHQAFLWDLTDRLLPGRFSMRMCWALEAGEKTPGFPLAGMRQVGDDLGERLFRGLFGVAAEFTRVGAVGSDHPELAASLVDEAFDKLGTGSDVVLGPAEDGGYYLVATRAATLQRRIFEDIPWSTADVLETTIARCEELRLTVGLIRREADVDTLEDLRRLSSRLSAESNPTCPRTRQLLQSWDRLE